MQWLAQKKREIRAGDAAAEGPRGAPDAAESGEEVAGEGGDAVGAAIGEGGFREGPDALVGVQFRRVGRQELEMETWEAVTQSPDGRASVDAAIVPQHDDRPAQVTEKMAEKLTDLGLVDVRPMQAVVETEVSAAWSV